MKGMAEQSAAEKLSIDQSVSDALEQTRLRRAYRHAAASQIARLANNSQSTVATEAINGVDNTALDTLPHWCLLADAPMLTLQQVCAAVFLAPALQQSIDGSRLNGWRECFGSTLFDSILAHEPIAQLAETPPLPEASVALMNSTGASVLLSTLINHPAQSLLEQRTGQHNGLIDNDMATRIYLAASALQERLQHERLQEDISEAGSE